MFGQMFLKLCWAFTRSGAELAGDNPEATLVRLAAAHQELKTRPVLVLVLPSLVALQVPPEVIRLDKPFPALREEYEVEKMPV